MPIYEYQCGECDHIEEVLQKSTEGFYFLGKECPNCNVLGRMTRLLSLGSFQLKGDGWYKDGYGTKKPESKPSPPKTADGVTEAKPLKDE